jgi:1-acyl-sn-glycerol-3-phosphate acyltransferase
MLARPLKLLAKNVFYRWIRFWTRVLVVGLCDFRVAGREHLDGLKGAMILSTHQSMLDPVLVGICFNDRLNYLARKTLFKNGLFAFLIRVLDAIEIDRERGGLSGLREMLTRLNQGKKVLIFPEGTRTYDGQIGDLKMGFAPIARRSHVPLVPVAVVGAFRILPRGAKLPNRERLAVVIGTPIDPARMHAMTDEQLKVFLQTAMEDCKLQGESLIRVA